MPPKPSLRQAGSTDPKSDEVRNPAIATQDATSGPGSLQRDPAGKRRRVETGSVGEPATMNGRVLTEAEIKLAARPLPPRYPSFPTNGTMEDISKYNMEIVRIHQLGLKDPARNLPTVTSQVKDPITAAATSRLRDKNAVLKAASSIVDVTSTTSDGSRNFRCTGIILGVVSDETGIHAKILTSSRTVCTFKGVLQDPKPKLSIRLPNMIALEGHLLFFNDHYRLALLDIMVDSLQTTACFGTNPQYGQEVFVVARDEDSSLVARRGTILFIEEHSLGRNYNMFLNCEIPECGTGGPVIDHDGLVTGLAFHRNPDPAIIGISTILTCIEMWTQFRSVPLFSYCNYVKSSIILCSRAENGVGLFGSNGLDFHLVTNGVGSNRFA